MVTLLKDKNGQTLSWSEVINKFFNRIYSYYLDAKVALLWFLGFFPSHLFRRLIFSLAGVKLGAKSTIHIGARFYQPKNITIGKGSIIGDRATLDGRDQLTIGNHVDIASEVMLINGQHDIHSVNFDPIFKPIAIKDYCFIGPRAIILPGVTINTGAVVAAGAVVTKDVDEKTIVAGIPAKPIGTRNIKNLKYCLGRPKLFQ